MNAKVKAITLSTATVDAIGAWAGQSVKVDNAKVKAVDSLYADGVTAAMLVAPEKGESTVLFDSVKVSIVTGFTATVQALLKKDTKTLTEAQKENKRYWQQQIGSKMKDLRSALERREKQGEESAGAGSKPASFDARLKKDLVAWIAKVEKLEKSSFPVVDMVKHLKSASALIK
jgi:gas vesicle protein